MTQSNLLESAKQGDPNAIAALMNLTLEPRGIAATATLEDGCLQVVLSSTRVLNQTTLVSFVQKGLQSLSIQTIQTVKICGQKSGDGLPIWTAQFAIDRSGQFIPVNQAEVAAPVSASPSLGRHHLAHLHTSIRHYWHQAQVVVEQIVPTVRLHLQPYMAQALNYIDANQTPAQRTPFRSGRTAQGTFNGTFNGLVSGSRRFSQRVRRSKNLLLPRMRSPRSLVKVTLAALPIAFVFGGLVAVIDSYARGAKQPGDVSATSTRTTPGQMALKSESDPATLSEQAEARKYLDKMNRAQKQFYAENGRFAVSLEELERSANMLSLKSEKHSYAYQLTVLNETQAQLTATPKDDRLKSFTGVVFLRTGEDGTETAIAAVCESKQPLRTPPAVTKPETGNIQCPANASKIS